MSTTHAASFDMMESNQTGRSTSPLKDTSDAQPVDANVQDSSDIDSDSVTFQTGRIAAEAILAARVSGSDRASLTPTASHALSRYLDEQAQAGRLIDEHDISIAVLKHPLSGGSIGVIWDVGSIPDGISVFRAKSALGNVNDAFSASFAENPSAVVEGAASRATGLGNEAGLNASADMYVKNDGCRTIFFVADYSADSDHWVTTCFQNWAQRGTDRWIYNRWAVWNQAKATDALDSATTVDFTIRSRPWKGQESKVKNITNWTPLGGGTSCSDVANLSVGFDDLKLDVPVHQCQKRTSLANAMKNSMGVDWDGESSDQLYLDFGLGLHAADSKVIPVFADYVWAEVAYCEDTDCIPVIAHGWSQYLQWKDSGW